MQPQVYNVHDKRENLMHNRTFQFPFQSLQPRVGFYYRVTHIYSKEKKRLSAKGGSNLEAKTEKVTCTHNTHFRF